MLLTLEVKSSDETPLRGSLSVDGGAEAAFSGWLQLMTLLHETLTPNSNQEPGTAGGTQ
jgi:hypothetical protein